MILVLVSSGARANRNEYVRHEVELDIQSTQSSSDKVENVVRCAGQCVLQDSCVGFSYNQTCTFCTLFSCLRYGKSKGNSTTIYLPSGKPSNLLARGEFSLLI